MSISPPSTWCKRCGTEFVVGQEEFCPGCGVKLLSNGDIDHSWTEADYKNYKNKKEQDRTDLIKREIANLSQPFKDNEKKVNKRKTAIIISIIVAVIICAIIMNC